MKLQGKVALVTGAGRVGSEGRRRGFGAEICLRLARQGADIVVNDFTGTYSDLAKQEELEMAAEEIRKLGRKAITVNADVRNSDEVKNMFNQVLEKFGRIDILVNNAGVVVGLGPMVDLDESAWNISMDVMAKGAWLCSKEAAKIMIKQGTRGRIINIASVAGKVQLAFAGAYVAAKHALVGITRTMGAELITNGITVNAICPGWVDTHLLHLKGGAMEVYPKLLNITEEQLIESLKGWTPAGRLGTVEEIAGAVELLCMPEASYINGQSIVVDGGGITI
ncbi:MAG: hypothetical protein VR69_13180 [Peptococcaceae bacterium BRH_c4b]|nr:MAG: hypothetical protein VR69_13180 [Peptococcaceae bacterium BRH_c4b]